MIEALFALVVVSACAILWQDAMRAHDRAVMASRQLCARANLQLLDQTVSLKRLALVRLSHGGIGLRRHYGFEVSTDGMDRHRGSLKFQGERLEDFSLPLRTDSNVVPLASRLH